MQTTLEKCDHKKLGEYLNRYGWTSYCDDRASSWKTGWQSGKQNFEVCLSVNDNFVCFEVRLMKIWENIKRKDWFVIFKILLKLNADTKLVKLCLNEKQELLLKMDFLSLGFSFEHLVQAIGIVAYYSENLYEMIKGALFKHQYRASNTLHN